MITKRYKRSELLEKLHAAAYKYWDDICWVTSWILQYHRMHMDEDCVVVPDRCTMNTIQKDFPKICIEVKFTSPGAEHFAKSGFNDEYEWHVDMNAPSIYGAIIFLEIPVDDVNEKKIRTTLMHELNHLYEKLERMKSREDKSADGYVQMDASMSIIDLDSLIDTFNKHQRNQFIATMCTILYTLWDPSERNAFTSEEMSLVLDQELQARYEDTKAFENLEHFKAFFRDYEFIERWEFEVVMKGCFKEGTKRTWLNDWKSFKLYFKTTSLKLMERYEKNVKAIIKGEQDRITKEKERRKEELKKIDERFLKGSTPSFW